MMFSVGCTSTFDIEQLLHNELLQSFRVATLLPRRTIAAVGIMNGLQLCVGDSRRFEHEARTGDAERCMCVCCVDCSIYLDASNARKQIATHRDSTKYSKTGDTGWHAKVSVDVFVVQIFGSIEAQCNSFHWY